MATSPSPASTLSTEELIRKSKRIAEKARELIAQAQALHLWHEALHRQERRLHTATTETLLQMICDRCLPDTVGAERQPRDAARGTRG